MVLTVDCKRCKDEEREEIIKSFVFQNEVEKLLIEKGFERDNDIRTLLEKLIWLVGEGIESIIALLDGDIDLVKEELADVFFYTNDAMNRCKGSLPNEFFKKLDKNYKRPKRYGRNEECKMSDLSKIANFLKRFHSYLDIYKKDGNFLLINEAFLIL